MGAVVFAEEDNRKPPSGEIVLGCDLATFSLEDIDERIALLHAEIERLKQERTSKASSLNAAEAFFKKV